MFSVTPPLHDSDLFLGQSIEPTHQRLDLRAGGLGLVVGCSDWRGSSPKEERTLELDEIPIQSFTHFCPTNNPYPKYS